MIKDYIQRILPANYYKIDQELVHQKTKLIYKIINKISRVETLMAALKLTSDHDNYRLDISDRCNRPHITML
jgi:hypothetical protein